MNEIVVRVAVPYGRPLKTVQLVETLDADADTVRLVGSKRAVGKLVELLATAFGREGRDESDR